MGEADSFSHVRLAPNQSMMRRAHRKLMGIPPTGKRITMSGMDARRFVGAQIAEMRVVMDRLGMLRQLDVIPSPRQ